MNRSSFPALRLRPLAEWRLLDGTSGCSVELLWQGPDGFWRGIWAAGATFAEAEVNARQALAEALSTPPRAPAPTPPAEAT